MKSVYGCEFRFRTVNGARLDGMVTLAGIACVVSTISFILLAILSFVDAEDEIVMSGKRRRQWCRGSVIVLAISALMCLFVPGSKQAMLIWGLGQTVDYIQENEAVKELPDKCVEALEVWLESLTEEE